MPIGIDIVDVSRIEKLVKYKNFYQKVFTEQEFEYIKEKEYNHKTITRLLATKRSEEHRLNSSHHRISYAVFCLKKKMQAVPKLSKPIRL